jgi:hypothetical protein
MSIIGSSWKEDSPSDDEIRRFEEATGEEFSGSSKEFERRIKINKESAYASTKEIRDLSELEDDLNQDFNK